MKRMITGLACIAIFLTLVGCPGVQPVATDQFEVVRKAMDDYLSADPPGTIAADVVFDRLNDGDDSTTPVVLSVRAPEHYAIGHVPGAINIPWRTVGDVGALDDLPTDEQIVVYCYTGHTGGVATACLNAMGYDAVNMRFGMTAWTRDPDVRVAAPFDEATSSDFPTVTDATEAGQFDLPVLDVTTSTDEAEIIRAAVASYLNADTAPTISATDLFDLLNDGDETNDPQIVSVRAADAYAIGHIEGAINIPWKTIAQVENLHKIDPDRDVVVYCYTGHTGALATTVLNVLGYDATNLKFGMTSWTKDPDVRVAAAFDDAVDAHDYPVEP
jgi:rhodanese-related sulfurtransferase